MQYFLHFLRIVFTLALAWGLTAALSAQVTGPGWHFGAQAGINYAPGTGEFSSGIALGGFVERRTTGDFLYRLSLEYGTLNNLNARLRSEEYFILPTESRYRLLSATINNLQSFDAGLYFGAPRWNWKGFHAGIGLKLSYAHRTTGVLVDQTVTVEAGQRLPLFDDVRDDEFLDLDVDNVARTVGTVYGVSTPVGLAIAPRLSKTFLNAPTVYLEVAYAMTDRNEGANTTGFPFRVDILQLGFQYYLR